MKFINVLSGISLLLLISCGAQKQVNSSANTIVTSQGTFWADENLPANWGKAGSDAVVASLNEENDDTVRYFLIAPDKSVVAPVYAITPSLHDSFTAGRIRIVNNRLIGYANKQGRVVVKPAFYQASAYIGQYAAVCTSADCLNLSSATDAQSSDEVANNSAHWGIIDQQGSFVKPDIFRRRYVEGQKAYIYYTENESFILTAAGQLLSVMRSR